LDGYPIGDEGEDLSYKTWVLQNVLFLNPMNDLYTKSIAAQDILSLPNVSFSKEEENKTPWRHALFDQLKQEYVSARFLYFEGLHAKPGHFSDKHVLLYNSLDYPAYGLATEKLKSSFRALFSILDKIAYFLNFYIDLGIPERGVKFSSMWYVNQKIKGGELRSEIAQGDNWPLMGLYWLNRDLVLDEGQEVLEPELRDIREIRNALEHKFLRLHLESAANSIVQETPISVGLSRVAFEAKGFKLLKLVRAALTYLHGSVYIQEDKKRRQVGDGNRSGFNLGFPLTPLDDNEKR
jgi:hypothetical protein